MPAVDLVATTVYNVATMIQVSIRELRNRLSHYLRRLEEGEHLTVTKRGKPVATVAPVGVQDQALRILLELRERGVIHWSGGKPKGLTPGVKLTPGPDASDIVIQGRE